MPKEETDPTKKSDREKTFDQADVDRIVQERLAKEKAKFADYDDLKAKAAKVDELEASKKTDLDKLTEQIEGLTKSQAETEQRALRAEIATAKGLSSAQAKRLIGTTKEELEADADDLLENLPVATGDDEGTPASHRPPTRKPATDLRGGGEPNEDPVELDPLKLASNVPTP